MKTGILESRKKNFFINLQAFFLPPQKKTKVEVKISPHQEIERLEQLKETLFEVGRQLNLELCVKDNHEINEKMYTIRRYVQGVHTLLSEVINFKKGKIMDIKEHHRSPYDA